MNDNPTNEELPTVVIAEGARTHISEIVVMGADDDDDVAVSLGIAHDGTEVAMLTSPAGTHPELDPHSDRMAVPINGLLRAIDQLRSQRQ